MSHENRIADIKSAVDEFLRRLRNWLEDTDGTAQIPEAVKSALSIANLACGGDVPECCRTLAIVAVPRLVEEMRKFNSLEQDCFTRVGNIPTPMPRFWAAVKAVREARDGAEEPTVERLEPVSVLRKQGVSDDQIAKSIYGRRGEGPFVQPNGAVDLDLIERQCEWEKQMRETGKALIEPVVPANWIPPWYRRDDQARKEELKREIEVYERLQHPRRYEDPATVEELLKDGAFVQQIEKSKTINGRPITRDEILAIAHRIGVVAHDQPGSSYRVSEVDDDDESDAEATGAADKDALRALVIEAYLASEGTKGAADIATELKQAGHNIKGQQVAAMIQHYKQKQKKQTPVG